MNWRRCGKDELEKLWEGLTGEDVGRMNWRCGNCELEKIREEFGRGVGPRMKNYTSTCL
jgi:hypothetical protein